MNKLIRFLIIDLILLLICIMGIFLIFNKAGLNIPLQDEGGKLTITANLSARPESAVRPGDDLIAINSISVSRPEDVEYLCEQTGIGREVQLTLNRSGEVIETEWRLGHYYTSAYISIVSIVSALYFFLALFVFLKAQEREEAIIFHWLSIAIAILTSNRWGISAADTMPYLSHVCRAGYAVAYAFIPVLFLHFSQIFPRKSTFFIPKYILYVLAGALALWVTVQYFIMVQTHGLPDFHDYLTVINIIRANFIIITIISVLQFIITYRQLADESERRKLRWIFFGLITGTFSFMFLWQLPQIIYSKGFIDEKWIFIISLILPVSFAISIVRYHLLDIDLLLKRSTVYFIVLGLMIIMYAGIIVLAITLAGPLSINMSISAMVLTAVLIALLFEPVKTGVHRFIDKKFFRVHYNFSQIQESIAERLKTSISKEETGNFISREINLVLQPEEIYFVLKELICDRFEIISSQASKELSPAILNDFISKHQAVAKPVITQKNIIEPGIECLYADPKELSMAGLVLFIPIPGESTEIIGWIMLGRKKSGQIFTREDIGLLNAVSNQAGMAITRLELQKKLLLKATEADQFQKLNEMKSFFVSSVSHELQTPLTSIKMFAEMLRLNPAMADEKKTEYLSIIENESNRLASMIKNILDFSKIERGILRYYPRTVNLVDIVQRLIAQLEFPLKAENIRVEIRHKYEQISLMADENALQSCLLNLISNAIKYAGEEKYLGIFTGIQGHMAVIQIKDHGIGIRPEEKERIFDTFFRSEDQRVQSRGGAGLGLYLVRHFVEKHHGRIIVDSTPETGSTFTVELPMESGHA